MKIKSICIVLMILFTQCVFAQKSEGFIKVFMSDGTVHVGERIQENRNELEIQTTALKTITLDKSLIGKIKKLNGIPSVTGERYHKSSGYFVNAELALSFRSFDRLLFLSSLTIGKRLSSKLDLGAGLGISTGSIAVNDTFNIENEFIHTFAYGKYNFNDKNLKPFLDLKAGWGFSLVDDWERNTESGGLFLQPGIGFDIANKKKLKWSFKVSQIIQNVSGHRIRLFPVFSNEVEPQFLFFENRGDIIFNNWYNRTAASITLHF